MSQTSYRTCQPVNFCTFCRRNREPEQVYMSHRLKDSHGNVTCPQLFKYRCELCGSTGKEAHTRSYCPIVTNMRRNQSNGSSASISSAASFATNSSWRRGNPQNESRCSSSSSIVSNVEHSGEFPSQPNLQVTKSGIFRNMGRVTNSRYNSAGRLRHPRQAIPQPPPQVAYQHYQPAEQQQYATSFDYNSI